MVQLIQREHYDLNQFTTDTVSVKEAAGVMRVSPSVVRSLLETGELHGGKFRTTWRVNRALMYQYILDHMTGVAKPCHRQLGSAR